MATAFPGQAVHPTQSNFRRTPAAKPPTNSLPPPNLSRNRNSPTRAHHRQTPTHERPALEVDELVKFLYADLPHLFDEQGIDRTMYDDKVKFRDPITKHDTISGYLFNIQLLRMLFSPDFQLHSVKQSPDLRLSETSTLGTQ
ncbi:hypothetical protein Scep_008506 [Stephania cephalantha]|uniref:Uncharacterized protein n=1 Tax=Stephania cephalantha TaxID=152367 RepID=A0AAP0KDT3_9MAGN